VFEVRLCDHLVTLFAFLTEARPHRLFLFVLRSFNLDIQLQNNLNRWYDAPVGRWLSEDPIGFAGGDGNLYRDPLHNPHTTSL